MSNTSLNVDKSYERTEFAQEIRKTIAEKIMQVPDYEQDVELTTSLLTALRDLDKQELAKLKMLQEKEDGDKDRAIAARAIEIQMELERQRRSQHQQAVEQGLPTIPNHNESAPQYTDSLGTDVEGDSNSASEKIYQPSEWSDFQKEMIGKGLDPRHRLDEFGNIIKIEDDIG